ncbi:MAG: fused MFS/spermidine synthase [Rothia sp. (in: high G+C Gram-positive bacteria)]|uniref:spermidine synthase n=1 Tax=Rothia sp. (in: high G+C Gram-positive bacteria) TaxID=1885016 RepID=UPI0026E098C7|nr:fused MFS/spermidine synthase [Rothia sp. (in: high G+C Gram-positive bacteria)]MDO5749704.1 fused MFS/spermidine synthase [Rothia sp. (in: high G+C Gram-positive bacteria)]
MAKKSKKQSSSRASEQEKPVAGAAAGVYEISTGTAELVPDGYHADGWLLLINGVQSSHVIVGQPQELDFEYMRWIAALVRSHVGEHLNPQALRITHLGGGACSMARYFADVYPASRNTVVELDARLAELVRGWFDIPKSPRVKIRVGEAGAVAATFVESSRDIVIRDVFAGDVTPVSLTTSDFVGTIDSSLAPGGLYVINCGDDRTLANAKADAAALLDHFEYACVIADSAMLKGRRRGNVILAGSHSPLPEAGSVQAAAIARELMSGGVPAQYWDSAKVRAFAGR